MAKKSTKTLFTFMTKTAKATIPVVAGVGAVGLTLRYFGDKPVLKDIAKGLKGDVVGLFK